MKKHTVRFEKGTKKVEENFSLPKKEARNYIDQHNGTDHGHFKDYKGGFAAVVEKESGRICFETPVV